MALETEFDQLVQRLLQTLMAHPEAFGEPKSLEALPQAPVPKGLPEFVLESEAGLLLGEPPARSLSVALPMSSCAMPGSVAWTFGKPLKQAALTKGARDFLQVILVESTELVSRVSLSRISSLRSLVGHLPGYLAHSVGTETTARIHAGLLAAGLDQAHLARAHLEQGRSRGFGGAICVAVGLPTPEALDLLAWFPAELKRLNAALSAEAVAPAGSPEPGCNGKTCVGCDERDVCDKVRAVLAAHERNGDSRGTI